MNKIGPSTEHRGKTMYVKIRRRQREVNIHRICSRRNNIHKSTVDLTVYTNFIKSNRKNIVIESIKSNR